MDHALSFISYSERCVRFLHSEIKNGRLQEDVALGWRQLCVSIKSEPHLLPSWIAGCIAFRGSIVLACHGLRLAHVSCRTPLVASLVGVGAISLASTLAAVTLRVSSHIWSNTSYTTTDLAGTSI